MKCEKNDSWCRDIIEKVFEYKEDFFKKECYGSGDTRYFVSNRFNLIMYIHENDFEFTFGVVNGPSKNFDKYYKIYNKEKSIESKSHMRKTVLRLIKELIHEIENFNDNRKF